MPRTVEWEPPENYVRFQMGDRRAQEWPAFEQVWQRASLPERTVVPATMQEPLEAWITVEDDCFVVYLPPADPTWGRDWQRTPTGFAPTRGMALDAFDAWARQYIDTREAG